MTWSSPDNPEESSQPKILNLILSAKAHFPLVTGSGIRMWTYLRSSYSVLPQGRTPDAAWIHGNTGTKPRQLSCLPASYRVEQNLQEIPYSKDVGQSPGVQYMSHLS